MNYSLKNIFSIFISALFAVFVGLASVQAQEAPAAPTKEEEVIDLDELLERVRQGIQNQTAEFRAREAEFLASRNNQRQILNQARQTRTNEERRSDRLEAQYNTNEQRITTLTTQLRQKLGNLSEVFGVLQTVAGDTRSNFQDSFISVEFPGREASLSGLIEKAATGTDLPTIEEISGLWLTIMDEMNESRKITSFEAEILRPDGTPDTIQLTRVGDFNIVSEGRYFTYDESGKISELSKQPPGRFTSTIDDLIEADSGEIVYFGMDPSRGQLLSVYVDTPSLMDRIHQGRLIGYITIFMGFVGVLVALERIFYFIRVGAKVRKQAKEETPNPDNPLGRVLLVYHENEDVDVETLELKLDEAILKETPALERLLTPIKLISAVAPLLGLLGTVTGMIVTFQAITLFGTGDPKLMAGGISQALVTTVLGLTVAIPTLLLYSVVSGMSKSIVHVLEEQSAGKIAEHAEKEG